jgi:signal peptidase I
MTSSRGALLIRRYLTSVALIVPPVLHFRDNFYSIFVVRGTSMEPNLKDGDVLLVRKSDVYPERMWRRWVSAGSSNKDGNNNNNERITNKEDEGDDDKEVAEENDSLNNSDALHVMAYDVSSGRPIGNRHIGYTYLKPPTIYQTGIVILYRAPDAEKYPMGEYRVKRVIGLGGQICSVGRDNNNIVTVPPFALWVEGDNNGNLDDVNSTYENGDLVDGTNNASLSSSIDSRTHGPVCKNNIIGIAERIIWPPNRWRTIPRIISSTQRSWWM